TAMPGHCYEYRISDTDMDGRITVRHEIRVVYTETLRPAGTRLSPAYPNPFNPETRLSFSMTDDSDVSLSVLDSNGRVVRQLLSKAAKKAGTYNLTWDATDNAGLPVPAGVYMIVLQAGGLFHSQRVLYLK
ncbi:T9SS type A sorting domain-containing protein, partial [bacterium]|nr:T9SS type A sorting domain-containing protein [bacterium]